jgi:CRP-like cAMP-binding protein
LEGEAIDRVYFPYTGVVSLVVGLSGGQFIEAAMFGRNSLIGGGVTLDGSAAVNQAIGQVAGAGVTIAANALTRIAAGSQALRRSIVQHEHGAFTQTQQVAACNALHSLEQRLSRWLLQVRDLVQSDDLPLTQDFLSEMLGVQRSSVSIVAGHLQKAGLIDYHRGRIHVLSVDGLRTSCCECYESINVHFQTLTGWVAGVGDGLVEHHSQVNPARPAA